MDVQLSLMTQVSLYVKCILATLSSSWESKMHGLLKHVHYQLIIETLPSGALAGLLRIDAGVRVH